MKVQTVDDVCELVTDGTHYTPPNAGSGVPFLTVKDMSEYGLDFVNCSKISAADFASADAGNSSPKPGDVLFSKDGTVGKVHVVTEPRDFAVLSSIAILRPKRDVCDPQYLGHALKSPSIIEQAARSKTGSAIRRVILSDLRRLNFPLPAIDEQRRIAAILDKANELRTKRRQALAHLDTLTQSIFQEMERQACATPRIKLSEVCVRIQTGPFGSLLHKEDYVAGGIPLVNPMHIRDGKIFADPAFSVSAPKFDQLDSYSLVPGDVVLGRRGELGRCAEVLESHGPMLCGTGSLIVRPFVERLSSTYLSAVLSSRSVKNKLSEVAQGATMLNLNTKIVGGLEIPLPPLELQQTFATRIVAVERLKELHRKHLAELDTLFASLQHRAFKGEL